jgi:hypothetical protein
MVECPDDLEIRDAFGMHPHGMRSKGKDFPEDVKADYRLTSTQDRYRGKDQRQHEPRRSVK